MSTYWGYVCESHDPPLVSEHWFNHGEELLVDVFGKVRAGDWPNDPEYDLLDEPKPVDHVYATAEPIHWLRKHPRCTVALHNEYGDTEPIPERGVGT